MSINCGPVMTMTYLWQPMHLNEEKVLKVSFEEARKWPNGPLLAFISSPEPLGSQGELIGWP